MIRSLSSSDLAALFQTPPFPSREDTPVDSPFRPVSRSLSVDSSELIDASALRLEQWTPPTVKTSRVSLKELSVLKRLMALHIPPLPSQWDWENKRGNQLPSLENLLAGKGENLLNSWTYIKYRK